MPRKPPAPGSICDEQGCNGDTSTRAADGMVMVYVPAGEFEMGSDYREVDRALDMCNEYHGDCERYWFEDEQPAHDVQLDAYWVDGTEVTNAQYARCVADGACEAPLSTSSHQYSAYYDNPDFGDYPVISVDWTQAATYCEWAGARLPTEAEWEYAARGPRGLRFPWGDEFEGTWVNHCDINCRAAHEADLDVDDGYEDTAPVGSYPDGASWCGALDLAGNAAEWVADWGSDYTSELQVNPTGPSSGSFHVLRGGSWRGNRAAVRSANRNGVMAEADYNYGFRCVSPRQP
jgi:formylglycine-generating enzyme required for sulfatase activity